MKQTIFALGLLLTATATPALCADKAKPAKKAMMEMTKEQREEMAAAHENLAACLRSEKPMEECHREMMKSCKDMNGHCSMMGMGHRHGMAGKGMMCDHDKEGKEGSEGEEKK